ncbi:hypothetical protein M9Y10_006409 [Tritrichomonas musculus]|uniref:Uncharacterized protein n=1 Tax=Tritrichomonas musculus TaxID=1915356 RepID=A0ABR2JFQ8_9EUKA
MDEEEFAQFLEFFPCSESEGSDTDQSTEQGTVPSFFSQNLRFDPFNDDTDVPLNCGNIIDDPLLINDETSINSHFPLQVPNVSPFFSETYAPELNKNSLPGFRPGPNSIINNSLISSNQPCNLNTQQHENASACSYATTNCSVNSTPENYQLQSVNNLISCLPPTYQQQMQADPNINQLPVYQFLPSSFQQNILPNQQNILPNQQGTLPNQQNILLNQQSILIDQQSILPNQQSLLQNQQSILLNQQSILPNQQSLLQNQQSILPNQQSILPNQQSILPNQQSILPNQQNILSNQQSILPNQQSILPNQQSILLNQQSILPNQQSLLQNQQSILPNQQNILLYQQANMLVGSFNQNYFPYQAIAQTSPNFSPSQTINTKKKQSKKEIKENSRPNYGRGFEHEKIKDLPGFNYDIKTSNFYKATGEQQYSFYKELGLKYNAEFDDDIKEKTMEKFGRKETRKLSFAIYFFEQIFDDIRPWLEKVTNLKP